MRDFESVFRENFKALSLFRLALSIFLLAEFLSFTRCCFGDFYGQTGIERDPWPEPASPFDVTGYLLLNFAELIRLPTVFPLLYPAALISFGLGYRTRCSNV